jgi:hypothetical protein
MIIPLPSVWIILIAASGIYLATMLMGIIAFARRIRFGRLHHIAYFFSVVSAVILLVMLWYERQSLLLIIVFFPTLCTLILMPRTKPYTRAHTLCGIGGVTGYVGVWLVL